MWIINGPVCYQNDKLDHTFHVDYALQWVFTFECPLKSEYLFISAQMHVLPSKQLICWVYVKMVLAFPSLSISLYVSGLENMAKVHAVHIDPCVSIKILT